MQRLEQCGVQLTMHGGGWIQMRWREPPAARHLYLRVRPKHVQTEQLEMHIYAAFS